METDLNLLYRSLLSDLNREVLKPRGWKRSGSNFRRIRQEGMITRGAILNFQKSQWNTREELRFTVNAGRKLVILREIDPNFKVYDCHNSDQRRPQSLSNRYDQDQWWCLRENTDYESLKAELAEYLTQAALPWLIPEAPGKAEE